MRSTRALGSGGKSGGFAPMPGGPPGKPPIRVMDRGPAELVGLPGPPFAATVLVPSGLEVALVFPEFSPTVLFVPGWSGSATKTRILVELVPVLARAEVFVPPLAETPAVIVLVNVLPEALVRLVSAVLFVSVVMTRALVEVVSSRAARAILVELVPKELATGVFVKLAT